MTDSVAAHHAQSPQAVGCAVVTVSDTRTVETDRGGALVAELLGAAGHPVVARRIVPDDPAAVDACLSNLLEDAAIEAILLTGGTGISPRDQTYEAVAARLDKRLPGYGELFRMLSYQEIGPAAMLSRATAGLIGHRPLFTMPGSTAAARLAMERLIVPELGHVVREATK